MKKIIIIMKVAIFFIIVIFLFSIFLMIKEMKNEKENLDKQKNNFKRINLEKIIELEENKIDEAFYEKYAKIGEKYGNLNIEKVNINLPIYYGANYEILKKGIAHDSESYFPGEGGSVILAGHNFKRFLASLPKVKVDDEIEIVTTYGEFIYKIYKTKIIKETDVDEVPIQKNKEILMIYTCYPINNIGHPYKRFVVYANLVRKTLTNEINTK